MKSKVLISVFLALLCMVTGPNTSRAVSYPEVHGLSVPKQSLLYSYQCSYDNGAYVNIYGTYRVTAPNRAEPNTVRVRTNHTGYVRRIEITRTYAKVTRGFISMPISGNVNPVNKTVSQFFTPSPWTGTQYDVNRETITVKTTNGFVCTALFGWTNRFVA